MAITKKPTQAAGNEAQIAALIDKGLTTVSGPIVDIAPAETRMTLRIPADIAAAMETARSKRAVRIAKTQWILEAIAEKAARETER